MHTLAVIYLSFWAEVHYNSIYPQEGNLLLSLAIRLLNLRTSDGHFILHCLWILIQNQRHLTLRRKRSGGFLGISIRNNDKPGMTHTLLILLLLLLHFGFNCTRSLFGSVFAFSCLFVSGSKHPPGHIHCKYIEFSLMFLGSFLIPCGFHASLTTECWAC